MALVVLVVIFLAGTAAWHLLVGAIHRGVIERLALSPGVSVADVGFGSGRLAAMADVRRALKPGGLLSVTEVPFDPTATLALRGSTVEEQFSGRRPLAVVE